MSTVVYNLDQTPFKNFDVYVSSSSNLFDKSSFKEGYRKDWNNEHGFDIDLSKRFKQSKNITLECFIPAPTLKECIEKYNTFLNVVDQPKSRRLSVITGELRLEYQVFRDDSSEVQLQYDDANHVGVFKLKLVENMPVKRVLKTTAQSTEIRISSSKILIIDWGDGIQQYTSPAINTYNHTYTRAGEFYPIIMGDIDSITSFTTNATILWNKF